jgi:hypothetical protein
MDTAFLQTVFSSVDPAQQKEELKLYQRWQIADELNSLRAIIFCLLRNWSKWKKYAAPQNH